MQKLEERVHSARSRLPGPVDTPPRGSPRSGSALGQSSIPSTVTMRRSSRKRTSSSNAGVSSSARDGDATPSHIPQNRQSFGFPPRTPTRAHTDSRPNSRTSMSSRSSIGHGAQTSSIPQSRPDSRQSLTGARTPLGHYSTNPMTEARRPRSSLSNYAGHNHSASMSHIEEGDSDLATPTPRRSTFNKSEFGSSIPTPSGIKSRPSGGLSSLPTPRRISSSLDRRDGGMAPPERKKKLSGVGETC
jgi:hypothetical protein